MANEMSFPSGGHHENDPGAVANGTTEFILMDKLRNAVTSVLDLRGHKYETDKNHETNTVYQRRIKPGPGDVLIDFHMDAGPITATGITMVIHDNAGSKSKAIASELQAGLCKITGLRSRGIIKASQTPRGKIGILGKPGAAVLVELGFITNPNDIEAVFNNLPAIACFVADIFQKYDDNQ